MQFFISLSQAPLENSTFFVGSFAYCRWDGCERREPIASASGKSPTTAIKNPSLFREGLHGVEREDS